MAMTDAERHGMTNDGDPLETAFAAARVAAAAPAPAALVARVEADARRVLAERVPPRTLAGNGARRRAGASAWRALVAALGGWPGIGGLAAASATGLWIGFAAPAGLDVLSGLNPTGSAAQATLEAADIGGGFFAGLEEG